jgi:hypothetical protein
LPYFARLLVSLGPDAEAVAPASIRQMILRLIEATADLYTRSDVPDEGDRPVSPIGA